MNGCQEIILLLQKKKELLLEVEEISASMKIAPAEELMALFTDRGRLLEKAQDVETNIRALTNGNEQMRSALNNSCEPRTLDSELLRVYEESLRVKAVANRILREEEGIKDHITLERDGLLKKIQELNSSSGSVADSYRRCVQTGVPNNQFTEKSKKI